MKLNRTERLNLRIRQAERDAIEAAARAQGQRPSEFAREVLVNASRRRLSRTKATTA